jgi:hypothetical protein
MNNEQLPPRDSTAPAEERQGIPMLVFVLPAVLLLALAVLSPSGTGASGSWEVPSIFMLLFLAVEAVWLFCLYDLFTDRRPASLEKIFWLLALIFLNALGALFYIFCRERRTELQ